MKKLLFLVLLLTFGFFFVGCTSETKNEETKQEQKQDDKSGDQQDPGEKQHVCAFNQKKEEEKYLKTAATCNTGAVYYYSCECGEKGTETFSVDNALGHLYEIGSTFSTNLERVGVLVGEGKYRLYYTCARCGEYCEEDKDLDGHTHLSHECVDNKDGTHHGTCAICSEEFDTACNYGNENECLCCHSDKIPEANDPVFDIAKGLVYEELTQADLKAVYRNKGEETYASITVELKKYNYNTVEGGKIETEAMTFTYNEADYTYYNGQVEIGTYGWFPVSFKVNKCVDVVGVSHYIQLSDGNYAVYYVNTETANMATIHIFNPEGQLLTYKYVRFYDDGKIELEIYRYTYQEDK